VDGKKYHDQWSLYGQFFFEALFLFEFLFGRSLVIRLAVFPGAAFFGELP
jgi:hypothetical protein